MLNTVSYFTLLLGMPGGTEWILIIVAILLLFGGKKIPELMRGMGKGIREFKDAKENVKNEMDEGMRDKDLKKENAVSHLAASNLYPAPRTVLR